MHAPLSRACMGRWHLRSCVNLTRMRKDLVINVLLIIAGVLLAFALFGAGVLWKTKSVPKKSETALLLSLPIRSRLNRLKQIKKTSFNATCPTTPMDGAMSVST